MVNVYHHFNQVRDLGRGIHYPPPDLFLLVMEKLSNMILDRVNRGIWKPVKASRQGTYVDFFADAMIFCCLLLLRRIRWLLYKIVLRCSCFSCERKTVCFASRDVARDFSRMSSLPLTADLGVYLGVPIVHGHVSKETYAPIVDKVLQRLAGWKGKVLSPAGRRTLIQSTHDFCYTVAYDANGLTSRFYL